MNPNTMTLEDAWAWLWANVPGDTKIAMGPWRGLPPSLDALDRARPEGWRIQINTEPDGSWHGMGFRLKGAEIVNGDAPDRLTCEARLVVAMWLAEKP